MIMLFFFLIPAFFGLLGALGKLLYMAMKTITMAIYEGIELHTKKKKEAKVIATVTPKIIEEQKIEPLEQLNPIYLDFPLEMPGPNTKKTGTLMYVIVRKQPNETWTQSGVILNYEEAKARMMQERAMSKYPRLLKRVYI